MNRKKRCARVRVTPEMATPHRPVRFSHKQRYRITNYFSKIKRQNPALRDSWGDDSRWNIVRGECLRRQKCQTPGKYEKRRSNEGKVGCVADFFRAKEDNTGAALHEFPMVPFPSFSAFFLGFFPVFEGGRR